MDMSDVIDTLKAVYLSLLQLAEDVEAMDRRDIREWVRYDTGTIAETLTNLGVELPELVDDDDI